MTRTLPTGSSRIALAAALLAFSAGCVPAAAKLPAPEAEAVTNPYDADPDGWNTYANSTYTYCDAKVLAANWGASVDEAKVAIGRKLMVNNVPLLHSALDEAYATAKQKPERPICSAGEVLENPINDPVILARAWQLDISEVDRFVEARIEADGWVAGQIVNAIVTAPAPIDLQSTASTHGAGLSKDPTDAELTTVYANSSYSYCDAKVLSNVWGMSTDEAKVLIGRKLVFNDINLLNSTLDEGFLLANIRTPETEVCASGELKYDEAQIDKLAAFWSISAQEANAFAASKVSRLGRTGHAMIADVLATG
jgi:hypothetical protein